MSVLFSLPHPNTHRILWPSVSEARVNQTLSAAPQLPMCTHHEQIKAGGVVNPSLNQANVWVNENING